MTAAYRLTQDARLDLLDIRRYTLQQWGETQSRSYLSALQKTMQLLAVSPALGKARTEVAAGVLSFSTASHVIYYVVQQQQVVVFGVLHRKMVPHNHLVEREI